MVFRAWEGGAGGRPPGRWGNTCGRSCAAGPGAGGCPGARVWRLNWGSVVTRWKRCCGFWSRYQFRIGHDLAIVAELVGGGLEFLVLAILFFLPGGREDGDEGGGLAPRLVIERGSFISSSICRARRHLAGIVVVRQRSSSKGSKVGMGAAPGLWILSRVLPARACSAFHSTYLSSLSM